jgi:SAM-dependent methyltransferase
MAVNNSYQHLYDEAYFEHLHRHTSVGNNIYRELQRLETIELLCKPGITDDVLELGCGTGFYTRLLAPSVHRAVGVDFSPIAIEKAISQGLGNNTEFVIADMQNLRMFPDNAFDKLLAIDVLEHLSDSQLQASLCEIARLLRQDGVFVFFTPCRSHWIERLKSKNIILKQLKGHIGVRTEAEYRQIVQSVGLEVRAVLRYETCIPVLRLLERVLKRIPVLGSLFTSRLGVMISK